MCLPWHRPSPPEVTGGTGQLVPGFPAPDRPTDSTQQPQHRTDDQQNHTDRGQDPKAQHEPKHQQNHTKNQHDSLVPIS